MNYIVKNIVVQHTEICQIRGSFCVRAYIVLPSPRWPARFLVGLGCNPPCQPTWQPLARPSAGTAGRPGWQPLARQPGAARGGQPGRPPLADQAGKGLPGGIPRQGVAN